MYRPILHLAILTLVSLACVGCASTSKHTAAGIQPITSPALAHLPATTKLVVMSKSIRSLAAALGVPALTDKHRSIYEQAVAETVQNTGYNLLDPAGLAEIGVDIDAPWGVAWLGGEELVLFAAVRDPEVLKTAVYRMAAKHDVELTTEIVGHSLIIGPPEPRPWRLVVRERAALLVASDSGRFDIALLARQIAEQPAASALAASGAFTSTTARLRAGADVTGYMNAAGPELRELDFLLGASQRRPLAFGLDLQPNSVRIQAVGALALPLRAREQPSALVRATAGSPRALVCADIDAQALHALPWLRSLAPAVGALGIDLEADVIPLLAGELGISLERTGALESLVEQDDASLASVVTLSAVMEVSDPQQARALLERAVESPLLAPRLAQGGSSEQFTFKTRSGWNQMYAGVAGHYLYLSTDPDFASRLQTPPTARDTRISATLDTSSSALRMELDLELLGLLLLTRQHSVAYAGADPVMSDSGPVSDEYLEAQRKLAQARADVGRIQRELDQARNLRLQALLAAMGDVAVRLEQSNGMLVLHGSHLFPPKPGTGVKGALGTLIDAQIPEQQAARTEHEAWQRLHVLERELDLLRARDVQALEEQAAEPSLPLQADGQPEGEPTVTGTLDKHQIVREIRRSQSKLRYCYESLLAKHPDLQATTVRTEFEIGLDGTVTAASATGGPEALRSCVVTAFRAMRFPKPTGGRVKVIYPVGFAR